MDANTTVTLEAHVRNVEIGNARKLSIIAGPCQLESRTHAFDIHEGSIEIERQRTDRSVTLLNGSLRSCVPVCILRQKPSR